VEVIGGVAIDHFRWIMDIVPRGGGRGIRDEGKCIWIWRRSKDGGWKIARAIWNSELPLGGLWSGASAR
jgi:ketosteroid isomerase-like protein